MENQVTREILDQVIKLCKKYLDTKLIYIFGSGASKTMTDKSDLDIAFLSDTKYSACDVFLFAQKLADIVKREVDLINLSEASTVFSAQIIGTGILVYCSDIIFKNEYEIRVLKEYTMLNEERKEIVDRILKEGKVYE